MNSQTKGTLPENGEATAILISDAEEDYHVLKNLFENRGWTLYVARTLDSAAKVLSDKLVSVVLTERDLPLGSWTDVLGLTQVLPEPPSVIVISRFADNDLWAEALNLGAYDVLAKPLVQTEVVRVLSSAWLQQFVRQMRTARKAYKDAAANYQSTKMIYGNMLDHPDGTSAVLKAAENERRAFERYKLATDAYGTFLRRNRLLGSPNTEL